MIHVDKLIEKLKGFITFMLKRIIIGLLTITIIIVFGCIKVQNQVRGPDETGAKQIIGYVNTDAFYFIGIEDRMRRVLSWLRSERSIFYQPSPDDLLTLMDVCLDREIKKVGLRQPGNKIDKEEVKKLATDLAMEKGNAIVEKLKQGISVDEVAKEFKFRAPKRSERVNQGDNPEYDDAIFTAKEGTIVGPIPTQDRVVIFLVDKLGEEPDGTKWAEIRTITFGLLMDEAQDSLEDRLAATWNIRIIDGFYLALRKFYSGDIDGAMQDLDSYLRRVDNKNSLAHYLMFKIMREKEKSQNIQKPSQEAIKKLEDAVRTCNNDKLTSYYLFYLGQNLLEIGENEKAKTVFRESLDKLRADLYLAKNLVDTFNSIGDTEYAQKALEKKNDLEEQLKEEKAMIPRKPKTKEKIVTGEGELYEDPEKIWAEKEGREKKSSESDN